MHTEAIKVPRGQKLLRHDEAMDGVTVAMVLVSPTLFAVSSVTPLGNFYDHRFVEGEALARRTFDLRLRAA